MKCDRSIKRNILVAWGIRNINQKGREEVEKTIRYMMKKTIPEVREFVKTGH